MDRVYQVDSHMLSSGVVEDSNIVQCCERRTLGTPRFTTFHVQPFDQGGRLLSGASPSQTCEAPVSAPADCGRIDPTALQLSPPIGPHCYPFQGLPQDP